MQAFREEAIRYARTLYPANQTGFVQFLLVDGGSCSEAMVCLTEQSPAENRQYRIVITRKQPTLLSLPVGGYLVTALASGYQPHRTHIRVDIGSTIVVNVNLDKPCAKPQTLADRLSVYGLSPSHAVKGKLVVEDGRAITLDAESKIADAEIHLIEISNVKIAKGIFGQPDDLWPSDQSRYGDIVKSYPEDHPVPHDQMNLPLAARFAFREYVHGNSQAVSGWEDHLNKLLQNDRWKYPVFVLDDVTVGPYSTLHIGAAGLLCATLHVHVTGKVVISGSGPTTIDVLAYDQYGLYKIFPHATINL
jgi:hypothetical protein